MNRPYHTSVESPRDFIFTGAKEKDYELWRECVVASLTKGSTPHEAIDAADLVVRSYMSRKRDAGTP